ncbi:hypothetical protein MPG82_02360 [Helicobacter pylori]|uniref:hypothetical protein n=1 Tax=Helicobacter pylori TaxID=210 RepID=UPI001FD01020|nr:hypothetical protein [Helicobacter pylori]UOR72491.1 hypothetical protein MPG82_02360 [Helicobacter pylori]
MPPLKGILADRNDILINLACAFLMEPFQKTKFYPIACFKASLLNKYSQKRLELYGKVNQFILKGKIYG